MTRRPPVLFIMAWISLSALALAFAVKCDRLWAQNVALNRTVETVSRELAGQMWEVQRARELKRELDELRFLAKNMEANDPDLYTTSRAAWRWSVVYDVPASLIMAVAHRESNFDPNAVSYVNGQPCAYGIMQINTRAHPEVDASRIYEVDYNIQHGARILKECLDRSAGDIGLALFKYWGGINDRHGYGYPDRVTRSKYFNVEGIR